MTLGIVVAAIPILSLAAPSSALAHVAGGGGVASPWSAQSCTPAALATATWWYGMGARRLELENAPVIDLSAMAAFAAGIAVLFIALVSPIDTLGQDLFCVHMIQHLLLMLAAPPLLVHSRLPIVFLWAFAPPRRRQIGRWWVKAGLASAHAVIMRPAMVWTAFTGALVFWHIPATYQWALSDPLAHVCEHLCFFVTSLAFWTLVVEPAGRRRLSHGATLIFIATSALLGGFPGVLMVFAPQPLYPAHANGAAYWGLSPIEDQQLAGLLMWIPAGLVHVAAICWLFHKWFREAEQKASKRRPVARRALVLTLCGSVAFGAAATARAQPAAVDVGGDASHGAALITRYGCGGCHTIPGISGAQGLVGPPLNAMSRRVFIAGMLRNSPENMAAWLEEPQRFVPGNAMPNMGISRRDAQDIAAYLYTLR